MNILKEKTIVLRQEGKSYNEINKILGVPKSTLSGWLSGIPLSIEASERLKGRVRQGSINGLIKRNKNQTFLAQKSAREIKEEAIKNIKPISDNDLLLIGTILYWAEGYKRLKVKNGKEITSHIIGFTNSDPNMVYAFILFLMNILNIPMEKIFIEMRLFKHIDSKEAILYWMNATGLPESQFKKPSYPISIASRGKRPINRLPYGTVRVIVSSTKLFYKIIGFIEGVKEKLNEVLVNKTNLPR